MDPRSLRIQNLLTAQILALVRAQIHRYGRLPALDAEELSQSIRIAVWKVLESSDQLAESLPPRELSRRIYNKLVPLLLNEGTERLGLGLARRNGRFASRCRLVGLQFSEKLQYNCSIDADEGTLDQVAAQWALHRLRIRLRKLLSVRTKRGLLKSLGQLGTGQICSLLYKSRPLQSLLRSTASEVGSPFVALSLLKQALGEVQAELSKGNRDAG
ncbi:hypothetical protein [Gloeobacter morelensis]|uniref:hypothetical protein n=1 Tax=Gloeobacter morelensis TaxID=2907343 RepID=UPI001E380907|nr:hypothetical protein [Gloeobacter morelensis]UFP97215.1 hypothetical protein ISF26_24140 [Gloeobacter morelensis MG652769]